MTSRKLQKAVLVTRDAYQALLDLKRLVDTATEKTHAAELETVFLLGSASSLLDRAPGKYGISILSRTKLGAG